LTLFALPAAGWRSRRTGEREKEKAENRRRVPKNIGADKEKERNELP
jgi:hypothetical protein